LKNALLLSLSAFALLFFSGCASIGVVTNTPRSEPAAAGAYSIRVGEDGKTSGDISLVLAFSGGGTRAAALAYGVLQELRDTVVTIDGRHRRLLDEIDVISSVSGGSFTSAYYGLYGDRIFEDFENDFLRQNIQGRLLRGLLNPFQWFSSLGRTDMAVHLYEESVFHGATFSDMKEKGGPLILINASDLSYGVRFTFVQEYFDFLCSDISSFPVARAVTASSAVPVLFNPVVVQNYRHCRSERLAWVAKAEQYLKESPELRQTLRGLRSYVEEDTREYVHFVDGGITDNLGLRAIYDIVEMAGGAKAFLKEFEREPPRRLVILSVNAATQGGSEMDSSSKPPPLDEIINAISGTQIHRYNAATLALLEHSAQRWAKEMSTPGKPVIPYLIRVDIQDTRDPESLQFLNRIPTSFRLSDEQVDRLIDAGRTLLRGNSVYQDFLAEWESRD
jgi:NTE family protein